MSDKSQSRPVRPPQRPHCYICGATDNLEDDHVPPKGFFPPSERNNLSTAPLCHRCHSPLTKTDEAMRVWIATASATTSKIGRWIFDNKVIGSTLKRSPKLRKIIIEKHLHEVVVQTPHGPVARNLITMPQGRVIPFIRRLTKGFLYLYHPDYDYFPDAFNVVYRLPTADIVATTSKLATNLQRGPNDSEVFRVWHGITKDTGNCGAWIFLFYDTVCFVCFHGKIGAFTQQDLEKGYVEEPELPRHL